VPLQLARKAETGRQNRGKNSRKTHEIFVRFHPLRSAQASLQLYKTREASAFVGRFAGAGGWSAKGGAGLSAPMPQG
jgi:hypothetical protein